MNSDKALSKSSRALILASRPSGRVTMDNFSWRESRVPPPQDGEVIVETLYLSVDPTNRIWMSDRPGYMPPVAIGEVMRAAGLGRILASRDPRLAEGDIVVGLLGWQDVQVSSGSALQRLELIPDVPLSLYLGPLGMTGLTAWFGMNEIGHPGRGDTVVVSAAAGAVGSIAGQLARLAGARVVGIAGADDKCSWLRDTAGFDETINYRNHTPATLAQALDRACPRGIDVYFENVGGWILEAVLPRLNKGARIPLCGLISQYNETEAVHGPLGFEQILMKSVTVRGFIVMDFMGQFREALSQLAPLVLGGKIRYQETVLEGGLGKMVDAVNMLFDGRNQGKLLVRFQ